MIRIGIENYSVAIPIPIAAEIVVGRRYLKEEAIECESRRSPAAQPIDIAGSEAAGEATMLPRTFQTIAGIAAAGIMTNPLIPLRMDVGRFRVIGLIAVSVALIVGLRLRWGSDGNGSASRPRIPIWSWASRRNVSMADRSIGSRTGSRLAGAGALTALLDAALLRGNGQ